ncbi:hypothetical protein BHE74_00052149 [Ensete ventricosum]|nr:hypothetical protein BHE74_00052149 [Ensete ventricosum]
MKIGLDFAAKLDRHLISWKSSSDPSPGNYSYGMDPHGVPEVYIWEGSSRTFRTGPWNGEGWSGRPDMGANGFFRFHFVMNQHEIYYTFECLNKSVLCRAFIDESGLLQRLVLSNTTSNKWDLFWKVPEDICEHYAKCGDNGMCTTIYTDRCQCLPGFMPQSRKDWDLRETSDGCVRRTGLNCSTDGFFPLKKVKLPDTSNASTESNKTLNECQDLCLKNCSCSAFALTGESMCITWLGDLVDIMTFIEGGDDIYIRLAASELDSLRSNSGNKIRLTIIVTIPVLSSLLLLCGQLEDGQEVAVKRLSKNSIQGIDEFKTEASNILLDHEMNPKISDFGTARTFRAGQTEGNTMRVVGTCGYMSPEYAMGGLFSEKSDVFSFGVMLLEILSGKKNNVVLRADQCLNLLGHVSICLFST